ncbi:MAG: FkbM family methyltransferase [Candidatus Caldarchaeum sp.]
MVNWVSLMFRALLRMDGRFVSRGGGEIVCSGRSLLKQLVRLENSWRHYGEVLPLVKFGSDALVIPNYFGRDFTIPLRAEGVAPPSAFHQFYNFDVEGMVVLDVGAYLGDTPLLWIHKNARKVIAVEPVQFHFRFLELNVRGLPVECLNASIGTAVPDLPSQYGSMGYGLEFGAGAGDKLQVPVVGLLDLVNRYRPEVVKLNCEGCEHYVIDELSLLPSLGVKKLAVDFHDTGEFDAYSSLDKLREKMGLGKILREKATQTGSGASRRIVKVLWEF